MACVAFCSFPNEAAQVCSALHDDVALVAHGTLDLTSVPRFALILDERVGEDSLRED